MRTHVWCRLAVLLIGGSLLVGCGGSDETVSVPVVERPSDTLAAEDTLEAAPIEAVSIPSRSDTVQAQRFDRGRM